MTEPAPGTPEFVLRALRAVNVTRFPYRDSEADFPNAARLDELYGRYTHALADFIDAWRIESPMGYFGAASIVHQLGHMLPEPLPVEPEVAEFAHELDAWPTALEIDYPPKENA